MTGFVAAIDCGGTSTDAVLADMEGNVFHVPPAAGCNPVDNPEWLKSLNSVLEHIPSGSAVIVGMSGYSEVPEIDDEVASFLTDRLMGPHRIMNDAELAFRSALPDGDGVLLLAGTGSMAMARDGHDILRCGGWGHRIGDEGSAHWIGQHALMRAAAELDGRYPEDDFARRLVAELEVPNRPFGLIRWITDVDRPSRRIASVAATVDRFADDGDNVASSILETAADQLSKMAVAVARRAGLSHHFPLSLIHI